MPEKPDSYTLATLRSQLQIQVMTDPEVKKIQDAVLSGQASKYTLRDLLEVKYKYYKDKCSWMKDYTLEQLAPTVFKHMNRLAKKNEMTKEVSTVVKEKPKKEEPKNTIEKVVVKKSESKHLPQDQILLNIIKSKLPPVLSLNVPQIEFEGCSFGTKVWASSLKVAKGRADNLLNKERLIVLQTVGEVLKEYFKEDE